MAVVVTHAKVTTIADDAGDDPQIVGPNDWNDNHTVTGLGTAAEADTGDFATAAQGAKADTATQPADLATALADYSTTAAIAAAYQPLDSDLTTWAGLTPSANAQSLVTAASYAAMRGLLDLEAGTDFYSISAANAAFAAASHTHTASQVTDFSTAADARISAAIGASVQAYSAALSSWASVTRAAGFDTFAATPSSANLRALLSDETGTGIAYFVGGALGTPSSATLTNATGLPISTGVSGLGTNVAAFLATPSSANLRAALTDETGTGVAYFVGGALGTPSSATLTNATGLPVSGITASTSTALGVGSIELGHASDTTLARSSAGNVSVEGNLLYRAGGTDVAVADGGTNISSYTTGDMLYASDATTLSKLAIGSSGYALKSTGSAVAWSASREVLTAARTYYVRADGSDSNTGLVNSSGGAFLTLQKAIDVTLGTLDLSGYNVTISVGAGTYSTVSFTSAQVGAGDIKIAGDTTTPSNVTTGVITVDGAGCRLFLEGLNISKGTNQSGLNVRNNGYCKLTGKNQFSSTSGGHRILSELGGIVEAVSPEIVQGTVAGSHYRSVNSAIIYCQGATWTASGTATQTTSFAAASAGGVLYAFSNSSSGTFTGPYYLANMNGVVQTNGGGASYFPGSSAGSTATGGQYN